MVDEKKTCDAFREDLVALLDGELGDERAIEVSAHLKDCPACRALKEELEQIGQVLKGWQAGDPRPEWEADAERRIQARAERQAAARTRADDRRPGGVWARLLSPRVLGVAGACLLVLVVAVSLMGDHLRAMFATSAQALDGREYEPPDADTNEASSDLYGHKNMKDFGMGAGGRAYNPSPGARPSGQTASRPDAWENQGNRPSPAPATPPWGPSDPYARPNSDGRVKALHLKRTETIRVIRPPSDDADAGKLQVRSQPWAQVSPDVPEAAPPVGPVARKNGWYESSYQAGQGERERVEELVQAGVLVDGRKLRLGTFTRGYHQHFSVPARSALGLSAELDHAKVLASGGEVFLQIGIQAARREMSRRPPLNIALVIDRSGSMSEGNKMDSVRRAALRFVDDLRADDRATVIAYDDQIDVAGANDTPRDKRSLKRFISSLSPRGSTDIHRALDVAYRRVADASRPGLINTVILLSDGLPTAGNTDTDAIVALARTAADKGISTTTIGVGLDYNDALMMGVARRGQGHYHFVKDASSIEPIFAAEFQSLNRVVARALRLRIRLADEVVLRRVLGSHALTGAQTAQVRGEERDIDQRLYQELGIRPDRQRDDSDGIRMMIPYFFSGDAHVVMLQLWVPPGTDPRRIAEVTLKYKDMLYAKNGMAEREAVVGYARDEDQVVASINQPVKKNLLGFRAGEALLAASQLVGQGRGRQAADMVAQQAVLFREAGAAWSDAQLSRDAQLLGRYRDVILSLDDPALANRDSLRSYLAKTMSHSGYQLVQ